MSLQLPNIFNTRILWAIIILNIPLGMFSLLLHGINHPSPWINIIAVILGAIGLTIKWYLKDSK